MSYLETNDTDDPIGELDSVSLGLDIDCPNCGEKVFVPFNRSENTVVCSHCGAEIKPDSSV